MLGPGFMGPGTRDRSRLSTLPMSRGFSVEDMYVLHRTFRTFSNECDDIHAILVKMGKSNYRREFREDVTKLLFISTGTDTMMSLYGIQMPDETTEHNCAKPNPQ